MPQVTLKDLPHDPQHHQAGPVKVAVVCELKQTNALSTGHEYILRFLVGEHGYSIQLSEDKLLEVVPLPNTTEPSTRKQQQELLDAVAAHVDTQYKGLKQRIDNCLGAGKPEARFTMSIDVSPFFVNLVCEALKQKTGLEGKLRHTSGGGKEPKNEIVVPLDQLYKIMSGGPDALEL